MLTFFFLAVCPNRSRSLAHKCHIPQTIVWIILPGSFPHGLWPWLQVFTALRGLKVLAWWIYCWHLIVLKGKSTNGWPWGWTIPDPRRSSLTPSCKCSDPSILTLPGLTFNSLIFDQSIKWTPAWDSGQRLWMWRPTIVSHGKAVVITMKYRADLWTRFTVSNSILTDHMQPRFCNNPCMRWINANQVAQSIKWIVSGHTEASMICINTGNSAPIFIRWYYKSSNPKLSLECLRSTIDTNVTLINV